MQISKVADLAYERIKKQWGKEDADTWLELKTKLTQRIEAEFKEDQRIDMSRLKVIMYDVLSEMGLIEYFEGESK